MLIYNSKDGTVTVKDDEGNSARWAVRTGRRGDAAKLLPKFTVGTIVLCDGFQTIITLGLPSTK
jgi:hypothetical protein